jgi:class 3 adenylate cyclase
VSATTRDLLEGSGLVVEDAGDHQLKGLSGPRTLYRVVSPSASTLGRGDHPPREA